MTDVHFEHVYTIKNIYIPSGGKLGDGSKMNIWQVIAVARV